MHTEPLRLAVTALALLAAGAQAQIAADGSLGTQVGRTGSAWSITAGTLRDSNLFHSFSQFGVPAGHSATFSGAFGIQNIIARVTGNDASQIDGLLRSSIPLANLFLVNPRGLVFGPGARLEVNGSFHASTADYLRLGSGGGILHASLSRASVLSSAPPSAFGFLGPPAAISANGATLEPFLGRALSLVGGDIVLTDAALKTVSGPLNLASLASAGEVALAPTGVAAASGFGSYGNLTLSDSVVDASSSIISPAGGVTLRGNNLTMTGSSIKAESTGIAPGANIGIGVAGALDMTGGRITANSVLSGPAGTVDVEAGSLRMRGAATIGASTSGLGPAGGVSVSAGEMRIEGGSSISSSTFFSGAGGSVRVSAGRLVIAGHNPVGGAASGIFSSSEGFATGDAGALEVAAGSLELLDGGVISGATFGPGRGGTVTVSVAGELRMAGMSPFNVGAGIYANSASSGAGGDAGAMTVSAGSIVMDAGGFIEAVTRGQGRAGTMALSADAITVSGGAAINAYSTGPGDAGGITLRARDISLLGGGYVNSSTYAAGRGGNAVVEASGRLRIVGYNTSDGVPSGIYANSSAGATGAGGTISVLAGSIELAEGGAITSSTLGAGSGGDVVVSATHSLDITGRSPGSRSGIYAAADTGSTGHAGTATVAADTIRVDGGTIVAYTAGAGDAGGVSIGARTIAVGGGSIVGSDTYAAGRGGNVAVRATELLEIAGKDPASGGYAGIFARSRNATSGDAGSIEVRAGALRIGGGGAISAETAGAGNAGSVLVQADSIAITGGGLIGSTTFGAGRGGDVAVDASGSLDISGSGEDRSVSGIFALSASGASGDAGSLGVRAGSISLLEGGEISAATFSPGRAGALSVSAEGRLLIGGESANGFLSGIFGSAETGATGAAGSVRVSAHAIEIRGDGLISASTKGPGAGGSLEVQARTIDLLGGGQIASSTFGAGGGGAVSVLATERLRAAGSDPDGFRSGIFSTSEAAATGNAGSLAVRAGAIELVDGGVLTAATFGPGHGGSVEAAAQRIVLAGGSIQSSSLGTGRAGDISIAATGSLQLLAGGSISTETVASDGGNIAIRAGDLVYLNASQITTSVAGGAGDGGNIAIDPVFVVLERGSIIANAFGGDGGSISIMSRFFLASEDSVVQASSQLGVSGTVSISAPEVDLGSGLAVLSSAFLDASSLIRESCAARSARADASSFTGAGRGGLAESPAVPARKQGQTTISRLAVAACR